MEKSGLQSDIEDAAVIPIPKSNLVLVKSIDVFTPIVDEPEIMGEIAACNVTNDIFAMNVPNISGGFLSFLAVKSDMPEEIAVGMMKGVKRFVESKVNGHIVGGHTIYCEWPLIGGEVSGFVEKQKIIRKFGVKQGDQLILTKPIGIQPIMAAYRLLKDEPEILENYSHSELTNAINLAIKLMTTSNINVVNTIHSFKDFSFVHAMTDVTGFGLAGHMQEMLQHSNLSALVEKIPSLKFAKELSSDLGYAFNECLSAETAGGMLIAIENERTEDFSSALTKNGIINWIVARIEKARPGSVRISDKVEQIEIIKI